MAGSGSEVIGVAAHSGGSLRLACAGVLEHALRLLDLYKYVLLLFIEYGPVSW